MSHAAEREQKLSVSENIKKSTIQNNSDNDQLNKNATIIPIIILYIIGKIIAYFSSSFHIISFSLKRAIYAITVPYPL